LAKACNVLAPDAALQVGAEGSPINKIILVVLLGRKRQLIRWPSAMLERCAYLLLTPYFVEQGLGDNTNSWYFYFKEK
jgi:hypothetical protein